MMKIRTFRDKKHEKYPGFIAIDDFDSLSFKRTMSRDIYDTYYFCANIYDVNSGNIIVKPTIFKSERCKVGDKPSPTSLRVHKEDEFALPTASAYMLFGSVLKANGYRYNKKKCQLENINSKLEP